MFGLTPLGVVHTAISLVAVVAGFVALVRDRRISAGNGLGDGMTIAPASAAEPVSLVRRTAGPRGER